MVEQLTDGAIAMMSNNPPEDLKPVMQIIYLKMVNTSQSALKRYGVMLSDGTHVQRGMLVRQKNHLIASGTVKKGTVVRLDQFVVSTRMIIIIRDMSVVVEMSDIIGNPKPFSSVTGDPASGPKNLAADSVQNPRMDGSYAGSYSSNADTGRYPSTNGSGSYGYQSPGMQKLRADVPRAPTNSYEASANLYECPSQPAYQQPPPMYSNRGPVAKNEASARIIPISALTPDLGRWTIKARVTVKSELRHYNNARGDGHVFSFDLLDSDGGEIRITCFRAVADQFYDTIVSGRVYIISGGSLKLAQKNFNHLQNDHEIFLESSSTVYPCDEDDTSIPKQQFRFCTISDIEGKDNYSIVDVIGVVSSVSPLSSIMKKNGTETQKRTLQLKDMSGRSVEVTLWGGFCSAEGQTLQNMFDAGDFPVLALKAGRVGDFSGKSLGTISTSQLLIEPDFPEAHRLKEWCSKEGRSAPVVSISRESGMGRMDVRKTISRIKSERLGTSEKPDWITVSASIGFVKLDNFCYTACPIKLGDRQCSKKVTNNGDGKFRCERCDQTIDEFDYRYILQFQIQDHTGSTYVTAFQECAEELLGISAKELYYLKNEQYDDEKCANIINRVLNERYLFKLKVKEETYNDESLVKSTVIKADKLNYISEFKHLLDSMSKLKGEDSSPNGGRGGSANGNVAGECYKCKKQGHWARDCPGLSHVPPAYGGSGGSAAGSVAGECFKCQKQGHWARDCPDLSHVPPAYGGRGGSASWIDECYKCHKQGHWARDCPGLSHVPPAYGGRGGSAAWNDECYKCHKQGHWARDCPGLSHALPAYGGGGGLSSGRYLVDLMDRVCF